MMTFCFKLNRVMQGILLLPLAFVWQEAMAWGADDNSRYDNPESTRNAPHSRFGPEIPSGLYYRPLGGEFDLYGSGSQSSYSSSFAGSQAYQNQPAFEQPQPTTSNRTYVPPGGYRFREQDGMQPAITPGNWKFRDMNGSEAPSSAPATAFPVWHDEHGAPYIFRPLEREEQWRNRRANTEQGHFGGDYYYRNGAVDTIPPGNNPAYSW